MALGSPLIHDFETIVVQVVVTPPLSCDGLMLVVGGGAADEIRYNTTVATVRCQGPTFILRAVTIWPYLLVLY